MAEGKRPVSSPQPDIRQLLLEAQNRWLRPAEICEILKNYRMFHIHSEPPNRPLSGSVYLFDRKVLRYFRKDGHNWRKKKDGKTVKEAHERLKDGSIDVLHCYYAHGEEDDNFQRRSYWMLEEDLTHIVFVHYRNVKGSKANSSRTKDVQPALSCAQDDSPVGSNSMAIPNQMASMDSESPHSAQSSEYEDAETDNHQASPRYNPFLEVSRDDIKLVADTSRVEPYIPVMSQPVPDDLQGYEDLDSEFIVLAQEDMIVYNQMGATTYDLPSTSTDMSSWDMIMKHHSAGIQPTYFPPSAMPTDADKLTYSGIVSRTKSDMDINTLPSIPLQIGKAKRTSLVKQLSLEVSNVEGDEGLKKYDSFSRWMSKELDEVDGSCMQSGSGICWDEVENGSVVEDSSLSHQGPIDPYVLSPSLSQDQLFSIIDFSPCWAYAGLQTKVLVTGAFLKKNDIERCQWSCMFGEVEVPAEVLADGILRCYAPRHRVGRIPFYITCSNRLACSEVREFEYVMEPSKYMENSESDNKCTGEMLLHLRFEKMLSLGTHDLLEPAPDCFGKKAPICNKICSLLRDTDDDWSNLLNNNDHDWGSPDNAEDMLLQKLLKEKLRSWLLCKVVEDDKGPSVLDKEGQCIIHLAAALDYDWAIEPIVAAGVGINFRDASGWSALHWAAYYGREQTVVILMYLGAAPGLLTDPTSEFPSGRTPADLASSNGHKGIAGFLAEYSLTSHLSTLTFKESIQTDASYCTKATDDNAKRNTIQFNEGELKDDSSLKDSLSAVCTATQAAARIFQAFRMQSFHRKKIFDYEDESDLSDEHVLSLLSVKTNKAARNVDFLHAAAIRIQNKFRGWKGRKEFLVIRQRIVKIQAHVRGYQVRKRKKMFWTIGIVQKVILWRRKGRGLHHLQSEASMEDPSPCSQSANDDNYDLLKEGRKQSEVRLEKALARVKSMVQYPEARDQYRRLQTGVEEFKSKASLESILNDPHKAIDIDMIFEIEELVGEDAEMPLG